jgi:phospholipase C
LPQKLQKTKILLQCQRGMVSGARALSDTSTGITDMPSVRTLRHCITAALAIAVILGCASVSAGPFNFQPEIFSTRTPIKHLVVIYGENVSFDHYFATYPKALNPQGEPVFRAQSHTPSVNNLVSADLLTDNPNDTNVANGTGAADPFRLDRTQAATADQGHNYTPEQEANDDGAADLFPKFTGNGTAGGVGAFGTKGQVMGYYDGNTVTALWNYAQRFAMDDNSYTDTYGPSTPGALEVVSGQTNGFNVVLSSRSSYYIADGQGGQTLIGDVDPAADVCSSATDQGQLQGKNIGDLLNDRRITWGSFMGGFDLTATNGNNSTGCTRSTFSATVNETVNDYVAHHAWFQYFASTANPTHARPSSVAAIGRSFETDGSTPEPANHEYDINDFFAAAQEGRLPAVSYLKAPAYQDAHAGYSDPLDEQQFVVNVINVLQKLPTWGSTAVIVAYDDSDGWYDHAYAAPTSASFDATADQVNGAGVCGTGTAPDGLNGLPVNGRCGPGTRLPFLVISPWAKKNYVSHTRISQASVVRFIEDNWLRSERLGGGAFDASAGNIMDMFDFHHLLDAQKLILDPETGLVVPADQRR